MRVQIDPNKLMNRGISLEDVQSALENDNANLPTGTLWGPSQAVTVQADGQLPTAEQYGPLVIAYRNGAPVRLEELGRVIPGIENDKFIGWFDKTLHWGHRSGVRMDLTRTNLGSNFVGHDITAVFDAIKNSPALKEKSEFESTSAFETR